VAILAAAGIAAGESNSSEEIVNDDHVVARNQLVAMERPDPGEGPPVLAPGNPIRMTNLAIGPETRVPWLGEHTDAVLATELGLTEERLAQLRESGVTA
jgi:formyl-CoA transferase